ncbi:MAG TPA: choice-of-anchor Q domain-containing protein, partial [Polyangiaceae bacterium]|nr:choice-of-anchor Q domain-containing protein [Polyangiaceae bacterium]
TITNSVFYANTAPAIAPRMDPGSLDVISSTFFGNSAVVSSGEQTTRFLSCVLWGNGSNPFGAPVTLEYSDVEGPAATGTNFSADPLFVSTTPGAIDLRLSPGSPCIDRAPFNASIPVKDFLGNDRYDVPTIANLNGSAADLGAHEYRP